VVAENEQLCTSAGVWIIADVDKMGLSYMSCEIDGFLAGRDE
jgi:hypothetical protein